MSDKHPNFTPYAYVYQNPMNLVDPWSEDTILFNKDGDFGKPIKGNEGEKDIYVKVGQKEFKNNKIKYKNGKLKDKHKNIAIDRSFRESHQDIQGSDFYEISDYSEAKKIFEFFADNTKVEWGHTIFKNKDGKIMNDISTSHLRENVAVLTGKNGYELQEVRHSHPDNIFTSSQDRSLYSKYNSGKNKKEISCYKYYMGKYYKFTDREQKTDYFPVNVKSY